MSALASVCITNHYVRFVRDAKRGAFREMHQYLAREGRFGEERREDEHVRDGDSRSADELLHMHDYYARSDAFEARGQDRPLVGGERSGACFCGCGAFDHTKLVDELMRARSNVVTSVVAVRRSDALEVGMDRQAAFERLLRTHWDNEVASWGLIERKDVRWCAFYHVDGRESLHVHVVTWDKSGRWGVDDERLMPQDALRDTGRRLNEVVIREPILRLEREKAYLRDAATLRVRMHLGHEVEHERAARLADQRCACKSEFGHEPIRPLDTQDAHQLLERVREAAPDGRVLQYARSPESVRRAAQGVVSELRERDAELNAMFVRHEQICEHLGQARRRADAYRIDGNGVAENELRAYVARERYDLQYRAASAVCAQARNADASRMREMAQSGASEHDVQDEFERRLGALFDGALRALPVRMRQPDFGGRTTAQPTHDRSTIRAKNGHISREIDASRDAARGR